MQTLQTVNTTFNKSPSSPNEGPFRLLNLDQIQNSQGKLLHLYRSPRVARKQNQNSIVSDFRKPHQKSPSGQHRCEEAKENAQKYKTELKVPVKYPPRVTIDTEDEENDYNSFKSQGF